MSMDKRSIVHIAGEKGPDQRCTRCKATIGHQTPWTSGWMPGTEVVNHGRGAWSVLREAFNGNLHRECIQRSTHHA